MIEIIIWIPLGGTIISGVQCNVTNPSFQPTDNHECTPKTPNIGDTLELDCPCGEIDFKLDWFYKFDVNVEVALVSSGGLNERNYTFIVQNASLGGVYRCACTPAESCPEGECTECFNVSGKGWNIWGEFPGEYPF